MSKRERIILVVMGLVVLYGVYSLFLSSSPPSANVKFKKSASEISKFVTDMANILKDDFSGQHRYILSEARAEWPKDPFWVTKLPPKIDVVVENTQKITVTEEEFAYTGYLKMGERKLAIINGMEYEQGHEMEREGHIVKEIDSLRVVIGPRDNNKNDIILLLDETR
jgi:hypothetical protein